MQQLWSNNKVDIALSRSVPCSSRKECPRSVMTPARAKLYIHTALCAEGSSPPVKVEAGEEGAVSGIFEYVGPAQDKSPLLSSRRPSLGYLGEAGKGLKPEQGLVANFEGQALPEAGLPQAALPQSQVNMPLPISADFNNYCCTACQAHNIALSGLHQRNSLQVAVKCVQHHWRQGTWGLC